MEKSRMNCSSCEALACYKDEKDRIPKNCPMITHKKSLELAENRFLKNPAVGRIARAAAHIEAAGYMQWTRLQELIEFARQMGMKKLGIAFCIGLKEEAKTFSRILMKNGFGVVSVLCKVGGVPKSKLDIPLEDHLSQSDFEAACNPVAQAEIMNEENTDLNIIFGLCIGHDILFSRFSEAPVTTFLVKDRVTGHNPGASIYSRYLIKRVMK